MKKLMLMVGFYLLNAESYACNISTNVRAAYISHCEDYEFEYTPTKEVIEIANIVCEEQECFDAAKKSDKEIYKNGRNDYNRHYSIQRQLRFLANDKEAYQNTWEGDFKTLHGFDQFFNNYAKVRMKNEQVFIDAFYPKDK
jgi:hypothetical protein